MIDFFEKLVYNILVFFVTDNGSENNLSCFKAAFIADIHLYSEKLGVDGRAYGLRSGSDQKCLAESSFITDSAFEIIKKSGADAVVAAGDLTNNGEKVSHAEMKMKLDSLNETVPVYAVTSTHDWCSDENARRYEGDNVYRDVPVLSRDEQNGLYGGFGKKAELSSFRTSAGFFSRSFLLSDEVRLILVNDDCDGRNGKSGYSEEHLRWLESEAKEGKSAGQLVIAVQHHLVLPVISQLVNSSQLISDGEAVASRLANAGVRLLFVGHSHMLGRTDFTSAEGNTLTQINLSALCGYPGGITFVTVENGKAVIKTEYINEFSYNGTTQNAEYIRKHTEDVLMNVINGALEGRESLTERLSALGVKKELSERLYKIARRGAVFLTEASVKKASRIVNVLLPGGGRITADMIKDIGDEPLISCILPVFLSVFDSSKAVSECPEAVRNVMKALASKITAFGKRLPLKKHKKDDINVLLSGVSQTLVTLAERKYCIDTEIFFNEPAK